MEDIRKLAAKKEGFKDEYISSMSSPLELIKSTFSCLELKGKPVKSLESATEEDIERLFSKLITVDSTVLRSDTQKKDLEKCKKLQEFLDHCCVCRHYFFSVWKCGAVDCTMCFPPRLPLEVFQQLHRFPDPMKATEGSDSYISFDNIYGEVTTEKHRPSIKAKPCTSDNKPFCIATETVCDAVVCAECLKPRCIYSIRRLKQDEFQMLGSVKEDILYVCGSVLFVETTALANICCVEPNVNCNSEISHHYFSCRKKFQECCYICGSFGDLVPILDERRRQFQSIHPVCTRCCN